MKVAFICPNFTPGSIQLQPRRYMYEIARRLAEAEPETKLITDGFPSRPANETIQGIRITRLRKLRSLVWGTTEDVLRELRSSSPDVIVCPIGLTSFLHPRDFHRCGRPIVGIYTTPAYELRDILRLGVRELLSNFRQLAIHVLGLLSPNLLVRRTINSRTFAKLIVQSRAAKCKLVKMGVRDDKIVVIPPGVSADDLLPPESESGRGKERHGAFRAIYFGPSLTLRGTDTTVNAFSKLKQKIPNARLTLQLRVDRRAFGSLEKQEKYLKKMCHKLGVEDSVTIDSSDITREQLRERIRSSDVILLPFKIVISDVPIVLLEAMASGVPVITTDVDGLTELVERGRGLVVQAGNPQQLAEAIYQLYSDRDKAEEIATRARGYVKEYLRWERAYSKFIYILSGLSEKTSRT